MWPGGEAAGVTEEGCPGPGPGLWGDWGTAEWGTVPAGVLPGEGASV